MALTETTYQLDSQDTIVNVSSSWNQFALENNGHQVVSDNVVGRNLREFIMGDSTSMWIYALIASARSRNKEIIRFYRCDSPTEKRFMKMTICPEENGHVTVINKLIRTEKMPQNAAFVYSEKSSVQRCSICNKVYVLNSWLEPDDAKVLGLFDESETLGVVFTVCPSCLQNT